MAAITEELKIIERIRSHRKRHLAVGSFLVAIGIFLFALSFLRLMFFDDWEFSLAIAATGATAVGIGIYYIFRAA